jgi:hypothetical protein
MNDKGCPGERLKTVPGFKTTGRLCASQWFWVGLLPTTLHVRVVCFVRKTGSYRQSRTRGV